VNPKTIYPTELLPNKLSTTHTVVPVRSMEQAEQYKSLRQVHNTTNTVTIRNGCKQQKLMQSILANTEEKHTNTSFIFH